MTNVEVAPAPAALSKKQNRVRNYILNAAASLFAAKGFDAVTIRDIAKLADVGLPTIYNYFQDKQDLYRQAVLNQQHLAGRFYSAALQKVEVADDFRGWLEVVFIKSLEQKDFVRLLYRELLSESDELIRDLSKPFQPFYERLKDKLNAASPGLGDGALPMLILSVSLGYMVIQPFRKHLTDYAPALSRPDLETAEQQAIIGYLFSLIKMPTAPPDKTNAEAGEIDLLRAAVVDLTVEKMKLKMRLERQEGARAASSAEPSTDAD